MAAQVRQAIGTLLDASCQALAPAIVVCKNRIEQPQREVIDEEDLLSLDRLPADYDIIYCCGSFINAPLEVSRLEAQALLAHLPVGGRWIE